MKNHRSSLLVITAALIASAFAPLFAAPKSHPAIVYRVSKVCPDDDRSVTYGSSRSEVLALMGRPEWEITSDVWVYTRYHANDFVQADAEGCRIMLVTFGENTVTGLKLANRSAVNIYEASPKARQRDLIASGKSGAVAATPRNTVLK